jgi:hypothetical protein
MVTQELINFIKSELAKGRSREQIHALLVTHGGWTEIDMAEAFAIAIPAPAPTVPQKPEAPEGLPVEQQPIAQVQPEPSIQAAPAPAQSTPSFSASAPQTIAAPAATQVQPKTKNYFLMGICLYVISLVIAFAASTSALKQKSPQLFLNPSTLIGVLIVFVVLMAIAFLINTFIIHKLARAFKAVAPTWGKAALLVSVNTILNALFAVLRNSKLMSGFLFLGVLVIEVIVFIIIAERLYVLRSVKAFLLWLCSMLIEIALIVLALFLFVMIVGATSAVILKAHTAPQTYQMPLQPSMQQNPYFQQ